MSPNSKPIYQIEITLKGSKPPIWRRILVPGDTPLDQMHQIIQAAMGWWDYHLHQFIIFDQYFGVPHDDYLGYMDMQDETRYRLHDFGFEVGARWIYEYDFGDGWEHVLLLEKILPIEDGLQYPICIKGRRACPPEDVGGIWGYEDFLEAIKDPDPEAHEMYTEWIGGEFDPAALDLDEINEDLRELEL